MDREEAQTLLNAKLDVYRRMSYAELWRPGSPP